MKVFANSKVYLSLLVLLAILCSRAAGAVDVSVYILSSGDTNIDNHVKSTLESFGHTVRIGVECINLRGAEPLAGYQAVLFLHSANGGEFQDMPATGQTALQDFVSTGGGLVTGEWVTFRSSPGAFSKFRTLSSLLPATTPYYPYNSETPITYSVVEPNEILNRNVNSPITFQADFFVYGTEVQLLPKPGATVFYDSDNLGIGVVGWDYGEGRVLSFSTLIGISELSNSDYAQLLSNALVWSAHGEHGPVCTEPIPGDVNDDCMLDFTDLAIIFSHWLECNLDPPGACWD